MENALGVNGTTGNLPDHTFDRLLPTLIECFAVIFCGYLCGRFSVLSKENTNGINFFTTNFALPSLLFLNLAILDFGDVNWSFIAGITLAKFFIFVLVGVAVAYIIRPINLSTIAIYAIFCTHANDFGLAYPILQSVYEDIKPKYPEYIYLIGLVSLVLLNPVGFFLIEIERASNEQAIEDKIRVSGQRRSSLDVAKSKCKRVCMTYALVTKRIVTNPNVFMTVFGLIANVAFKGQLPEMITGIFKIFSSTFQGSVLFLLGFQVVGTPTDTKRTCTTGANYLVPGILIAVKMLLSPLITRGTVQLFCSNDPDAVDLADYGFLYGTVPTAPVVLLYTSQYGMPTEMLATALVICTGLSAPAMYMSARMLAVQVYNMTSYMVQLQQTILTLSILGMLSSIWVTVLFVASSKWRRPPHAFTLALIASQALMMIGLMTWSSRHIGRSVPEEGNTWVYLFEILTITGGQIACRIWTAILAVTMCLQKAFHASALKMMPFQFGFGLGLPCIAILYLVISGIKNPQNLGENLNPSFLFGVTEACVAVVVLAFCLTVTVCCLVIFVRLQNSTLVEDDISEAPTEFLSNNSIHSSQDKDPSIRARIDRDEGTSKQIIVREDFGVKAPCKIRIQDMDVDEGAPDSSRSFTSNNFKRLELNTTCKISQVNKMMMKEMQPVHHATLLVVLCVSMVVGLTTSVWKVLDDSRTGIFVAMEFLDVVLNYGQSLFCLIIFGRDIRVILVPLTKWWQKMKNKRRNQIFENVDEESRYLEEEEINECLLGVGAR